MTTQKNGEQSPMAPVCPNCSKPKFDITPVMEVLNSHLSIQEWVELIDSVMCEIVVYSGVSGLQVADHVASEYQYLRELRDAIKKGGKSCQ